jgi:hypothetical protein
MSDVSDGSLQVYFYQGPREGWFTSRFLADASTTTRPFAWPIPRRADRAVFDGRMGRVYGTRHAK